MEKAYLYDLLERMNSNKFVPIFQVSTLYENEMHSLSFLRY